MWNSILPVKQSLFCLLQFPPSSSKPPPFSSVPQGGFHKFSTMRRRVVSMRFCFFETKKRCSSSAHQLKKPHHHHRICCSTIGNGGDDFLNMGEAIGFLILLLPLPYFWLEASDISDVHKSSADQEGLKENSGSQHTKSFSFNESMKRLRKYGTSGMLSYGLLNTAYYLVTFLFVWFYVAPAPGRMGYPAAVQRFLKIMAMVWAGSQVTKLARVAGALALAPVVDRGLSWFTIKFKFQSQAKAFIAIVGACFGLALMLFFVVTLLCA